MKKEKKLNSRGFTLIEVLAVIVILLIIVGIAIPNISASLDRQTCKTTEAKAKLIESAAQFYVSDNRNKVNEKAKSSKCKIGTDKLQPKYVNLDDLKDGDNDLLTGYVIYDKVDESYNFCVEDLDLTDNYNVSDNCGINTKNSSCEEIEDVVLCYD